MATNKNNMSESDTKNAATEGAKPAAENTETATPASGGTQPTAKARYEGVTNFAYVGPSLPSGRLKSFTILNGTYAQVTEYYKETIALYPGVTRLIVPIVRLAEAREKTQTSGNLMYNHYQELAAAIKAKGEEQ